MSTFACLALNSMNFTSSPLLAALVQKMGWLTDRQKVLAENVANADTPRYQATDLRPLDFRTALAHATVRMTPVASESGYIQLASSVEEVPSSELEAAPEDREINGNTVSIEDQMIKVSETAADYQLMTNLYQKQIAMLKLAIGQGGSSGS